MGAMQIRVLVVDDHQMFADALTALLATADDIAIVGTVTDAKRVVELSHNLRPDVVTLDANLIGADGIDIARELHQLPERPHVVMVTCVDDVDRILHAIWAGARAWVPKESSATQLIDVVRRVAGGESWLPPQLLGTVLQAIVASSDGRPPERTPLASLTPRERQVLRCMLAGLDRGATADFLGLSLNTVRTHAQSVLTKLHVHSTLEAVSVALGFGMSPDTAPDATARLSVATAIGHRSPARATAVTAGGYRPGLPLRSA
jgi:DNA-binding NarL/FixJ family response regulator